MDEKELAELVDYTQVRKDFIQKQVQWVRAYCDVYKTPLAAKLLEDYLTDLDAETCHLETLLKVATEEL